MELTVDQALQRGIAAHKEGKLEAAELFYRSILQVHPNHPDANHNLGALAMSVGKEQDALLFFKLALEANPSIEQFWLSYATALIESGHLDEARQALADATLNGIAPKKLGILSDQIQQTRTRIVPSHEQQKKLLACYENRRFDEAETLARSMINEFPRHPFGWRVLGAVLRQTDNIDESLAAINWALQLAPKDPEAHNSLGTAYLDLGRLEEAEASFKAAIACNPDYAEAHNNLGNTYTEQAKLEEAETSYRRALSLKPDLSVVYNNLGNTLHSLGKLDEAEASFRTALSLDSDYAEAWNNLGSALHTLGKLDEAEANYRVALALKPDYAEAHNNLANTLLEQRRLGEAEESFGCSIALRPNIAETHYNLGLALQALGRLGEAEASYERAIAIRSDFTRAYLALTETKRFGSRDEQLSEMLNLYRDASISDEHRCQICFALAATLENMGDFQAAFQYYSEGNELRKRHLVYNSKDNKDTFSKLISGYQSLAKRSLLPSDTIITCVPIFIVGMPRSGTTLVEQIISSHSQVSGAGELPFVARYGSRLALGESQVDNSELSKFREKYLSALKKYSENRSMVTDKEPMNFRYLGLITKALPDAKIIHVRRDPAAVCWANYAKYFANETIAYAYSLDDILSQYKLYVDLMKYWKRSIPGRIYDLDYESLTVEQESETRKLIENLGLDWEDACLSPQDNKRIVSTASNVQVRTGIYQGSSELWKHYRPYLNGALDHLTEKN